MPDEPSFIPEIKQWRVIAKRQEDYFLKFAVEYFAFITLLRLAFFPESEAVTDRKLIDRLKGEENCKNHCLDYTPKWIEDLKQELDRKPLKNLTRPGTPLKIQNKNDWTNIVEASYWIRLNLFHGHKYPGDERDQKLVEVGYHLLASINDYLIGIKDAQV